MIIVFWSHWSVVTISWSLSTRLVIRNRKSRLFNVIIPFRCIQWFHEIFGKMSPNFAYSYCFYYVIARTNYRKCWKIDLKSVFFFNPQYSEKQNRKRMCCTPDYFSIPEAEKEKKGRNSGFSTQKSISKWNWNLWRPYWYL